MVFSKVRMRVSRAGLYRLYSQPDARLQELMMMKETPMPEGIEVVVICGAF